MATIGRNAPCPCQSGKKYKKCCLEKDEAQAALRRAAAPAPPPSTPLWQVQEDDGLDELSNSVIALIRARRFDEALVNCQRLLVEFPEVVDGLERSAAVHAAMDNHALAADFYRKALHFVTHPSRQGDYEDGGAFYRRQIDKEEQLARLP